MTIDNISDPRESAMIALLTTAMLNTMVTWKYLPYFPIELSQMGWGMAGAAGGYHCLQFGLSIAGGIMFRYHVDERSLLGAVGSVLMVLLGLINGNDFPLLQQTHGAVALSCFVTYAVYIFINDGPRRWLWLGVLALAISHTVIFTEFEFRVFWREGLGSFSRLWTEAQAKHPLWVNRLKAITQYTMIAAFYTSLFQVPLKTKQC